MRGTVAQILCILVAVVAVAYGQEARVKLTEHGGLLVDGKPFLPIFAWAQPSSLLDANRELGINVLHPGDSEEKDPIKQYADKALAKGMLILPNMNFLTPEMAKHPAVLAWTVEHEPDSAAPAKYEPDLSGGATIIWIEGESAGKSTLTRSGWLDRQRPQLSGGRWLTADEKGQGQAQWEFSVPKEGDYTLWVREFTKNWANPTKWKVDDGQWQETPRSLRPEDVVNLGSGQGVGWARYGQLRLAQGVHTLAMEIVPGRTAGSPDRPPSENAIWAVDAFCFTTAEKYPPAKTAEPAPVRLPDVARQNREKVKALNPNGLTWMILTAGFYGQYNRIPLRWYTEFLESADIASFDHYPVTGWNRPDRLPEVGLATRKLVSMCRKGQPVWTVVESSDQDLSWTAPQTRGPNPAEMRAEVWMSIAAGAKGIGYFHIAFNPFRWMNLTEEIKEELKRTNRELTELAGPIVLGDTEKGLTVSGDETKDPSAQGHAMMAIRKEYEGKTYVIAVNMTRETVKPTFSLEGLTAGSAEVWKDNRTIGISGGSFSDEFPALAVRVYVCR